MGNLAGRCNTTGCYNNFQGTYAGCKNTTGGYNTFIGFSAGCYNTRGNSNIFIGCGASSSGSYGTTTGCNVIVLGAGANPSSATVSNQITLGNSSISTIRANVTSITSLSDARDKCDVQTLNSGMDFLRAVRPVQFTWNMRDGGKIGQQEAGFIAQELREVLDASELKPWLSDLILSNDDDSRLEAAPGKLLPLMVRAIQELQEQVDALKAEVETLKSR
jgi:hypothetical protein